MIIYYISILYSIDIVFVLHLTPNMIILSYKTLNFVEKWKDLCPLNINAYENSYINNYCRQHTERKLFFTALL